MMKFEQRPESFENPPVELEPRNERERALFEHIEKYADSNIHMTLKRLNRVGQNHFPKIFLQTSESCSGHVDSKGKLDREAYGISKKREPYVNFIFKSEKSRDLAMPYFRKLFRAAVDATNNALGAEVVSYGDPGKYNHSEEGEYITNMTEIRRGSSQSETKVYNRPSAGYFFHILDEERAYEVLKTLWSEIDQRLAEVDGLQVVTERSKESFYHHSYFPI